jgi:hypothetical protein
MLIKEIIAVTVTVTWSHNYKTQSFVNQGGTYSYHYALWCLIFIVYTFITSRSICRIPSCCILYPIKRKSIQTCVDCGFLGCDALQPYRLLTALQENVQSWVQLRVHPSETLVTTYRSQSRRPLQTFSPMWEPQIPQLYVVKNMLHVFRLKLFVSERLPNNCLCKPTISKSIQQFRRKTRKRMAGHEYLILGMGLCFCKTTSVQLSLKSCKIWNLM